MDWRSWAENTDKSLPSMEFAIFFAGLKSDQKSEMTRTKTKSTHIRAHERETCRWRWVASTLAIQHEQHNRLWRTVEQLFIRDAVAVIVFDSCLCISRRNPMAFDVDLFSFTSSLYFYLNYCRQGSRALAIRHRNTEIDLSFWGIFASFRVIDDNSSFRFKHSKCLRKNLISFVRN